MSILNKKEASKTNCTYKTKSQNSSDIRLGFFYVFLSFSHKIKWQLHVNPLRLGRINIVS